MGNWAYILGAYLLAAAAIGGYAAGLRRRIRLAGEEIEALRSGRGSGRQRAGALGRARATAGEGR